MESEREIERKRGRERQEGKHIKEQEFKGHPHSIVYQYGIKSAVRAEHF